MKKRYKIAAAVVMAALPVLLSACSKSQTPAPKSAEPATQAPQTELPQTEEPQTESETDSAQAEVEIETVPEEETQKEPAAQPVDEAAKRELTGHRWRLSYVLKDGEQIMPNIQYGSIINQTGAYLEFREDNSFVCALGYQGCEGTYTAATGEIPVHIDVIYDGRSEGIASDEDRVMKWNVQQGDIQFDLNGVTNVFSVV